jgi:hypothetical protein
MINNSNAIRTTERCKDCMIDNLHYQDQDHNTPDTTKIVTGIILLFHSHHYRHHHHHQTTSVDIHGLKPCVTPWHL